MVIQASPACAPSRVSISNSRRSSCTGTPQSRSWYSTYSGEPRHQPQRVFSIGAFVFGAIGAGAYRARRIGFGSTPGRPWRHLPKRAVPYSAEDLAARLHISFGKVSKKAGQRQPSLEERKALQLQTPWQTYFPSIRRSTKAFGTRLADALFSTPAPPCTTRRSIAP